MTHRIIASAAVFASLWAGSVVATPITAIADPALAGAVLQDLNGAAAGSYSSLTLGDVTISASSFALSTSPGNSAYVPPNPPGDTYILVDGNLLTFTFDTVVSAFGIQIGATNYAQTLTAYDASDNIIETVGIPDQVQTQPFPYTGFYGIAAGSATIKKFTVTNTSDAVVYDDLYYTGRAPAVPEPASLGLLGLALAASGRRRRPV